MKRALYVVPSIAARLIVYRTRGSRYSLVNINYVVRVQLMSLLMHHLPIISLPFQSFLYEKKGTEPDID